MKYLAEKDFIIEQMHLAFKKFSTSAPKQVVQKTEYDLVTELDCNIERYLIDAINKRFIGDKILSEEFFNSEEISGRTWTIDPIDGTCNFAHGMKLYGVQCALFCEGEIVVSAIYLPHFDEQYYAIKGEGAYLNDKRIEVNKSCVLQNAIASFGDYSHKEPSHATLQHGAIYNLQQRIAKIRMFGAACIDFSYVASGKTDATVILTKNPWDIAPGILLCSEAGATITNIHGKKHTLEDMGVVVSATPSLSNEIINAFKP